MMHLARCCGADCILHFYRSGHGPHKFDLMMHSATLPLIVGTMDRVGWVLAQSACMRAFEQEAKRILDLRPSSANGTSGCVTVLGGQNPFRLSSGYMSRPTLSVLRTVHKPRRTISKNASGYRPILLFHLGRSRYSHSGAVGAFQKNYPTNDHPLCYTASPCASPTAHGL